MWLSEHTSAAETISLVAWNGGACDLKLLWRLTQAPNSQYFGPANVRYFINPCRVIAKYKLCKLNKTKTKTQGHALGVVWSYIHGGECLGNVHDSIVNAKAQTDVFIEARFVPLINCFNSFQLIFDMFSKTQHNEWRKEMKPSHSVHTPWVELTHDNILQWIPPNIFLI